MSLRNNPALPMASYVKPVDHSQSPTRSEFAALLIKHRKDKDGTQARFVKGLNKFGKFRKTPQNVSDWERDDSCPDQDVAVAIANYFKLNGTDLQQFIWAYVRRRLGKGGLEEYLEKLPLGNLRGVVPLEVALDEQFNPDVDRVWIVGSTLLELQSDPTICRRVAHSAREGTSFIYWVRTVIDAKEIKQNLAAVIAERDQRRVFVGLAPPSWQPFMFNAMAIHHSRKGLWVGFTRRQCAGTPGWCERLDDSAAMRTGLLFESTTDEQMQCGQLKPLDQG